MCFEKLNERVKRLNVVDLGFLKICVFACALLLAKIWPNIMSLPTYVYASVFAAAYVRFMLRFWGKVK